MKHNNKKITSFFFLFHILFFSINSELLSDDSLILLEKEIRPGAGKTFGKQARWKLLTEIQNLIHRFSSPCCRSLKKLQQNLLQSDSFLSLERHTGNWESLEKKLKKEGEKSFYLLGFGSLLDPNSSSEFQTRREPAVAFGVKRFFGFNPRSPEKSPLGMPEAPHSHEQLRLTTRFTKDMKDMTNGVLFEINLETEMDSFRSREKGYDLVKVPILKIVKDEKTYEEIYELDEAYILAEPEGASPASEAPLHTLSPHISYLYVCLRGARILSEQFSDNLSFLNLFIETTYLSDEKTPISAWVRYEIEKQRQPGASRSFLDAKS
tara:strand:- start:2201 stop:3166 length:966 start_codon:yes stop_codon:yes gene_type:complete